MMHTNTYTYTHPSTVPRVAPSGAVVEQVVSPMACMLNPPGANKLVSARNLPTKTGSGTLPPDTVALQGPRGETFQCDACDGFAAIPKTCLPRHTEGKQQAAERTIERLAEAVQQIRPCFK